MDEAEVLGLFERCSNVGRWGADDTLGTLNFMTPARRTAAATLVRSGQVVSLARDLSTVASRSNPNPVVHRMLAGGEADAVGSGDSIEIAPHGYAVTHLDAFGHAYFEGRTYNGRQVSDGAELIRARSAQTLGCASGWTSLPCEGSVRRRVAQLG